MNRSPSLKPDWHTLGAALTVAAVIGLIALTWAGTIATIRAQRGDTEARVATMLTTQAQAFSEEINRQFLALDQTIRGMVAAWEADPSRFELEPRRAGTLVLNGLSRDMLMVDERGVVRQSSVPEAVGQNVAARDFFAYSRTHPTPPNGGFTGGATIDPIMRQWHLNVARWLHRADGSFAGAIVADYRVSAILDVFHQANVGVNGMVMLFGPADGRIRANFSPTDADPNSDISGTAMVAAMKDGAAGLWTGPSATDAVHRYHAYRRLPDRDLLLVVAMDEQEASQPATLWLVEASGFAGCITVLLLIIGWLLVRGTRVARERSLAAAEERNMLAEAYGQLELAKASADAKAEQLEATLDGMTDGVYMMDSQYRLVEWNARLADLAGIPEDLPRVGLPMDEILRTQARAGLFGAVDTEAEVGRRMAVLRSRRFGTTERARPDGRTIELRRKGLPNGGFVTLYSDITEHKRTEAALAEAGAAAEAANAAKSRFVAVVSHEIRTPLNALLNTLRLLEDSVLEPSQRTLVGMASQSGDALSGLINDILEMSRMEAGQLTLRPSLFALRPILAGALEIFRTQGLERGITLRLAVADDVPAQLAADPGRLRQVLLNLLSNAVKFARAGDVWLQVERDRKAGPTVGGLRVAVRDQGPVIPAADRERLFHAFSRLDRPGADETLGTGLGLAICHHLITSMGGEIGCEPWQDGGADAGNSFWLTLPASVLVGSAAIEPLPQTPASPVPPPAPVTELPRRTLPRTRILLVEDVRANQIVAATLLRRAGHTVDVAANGAAAIQAVERVPYDIVFMDIFMPGMSGQEATQRIRALPGPAHEIPIIALTANTSARDEVIFRAAGMDGVLGKPVSLPELLAALAVHVWPGHPAGEPALSRSGAPGADAAAGVGKILALDRLTELRANLPPAVLRQLVQECLTDLDERMPPFRRALASGIALEIETQAHTMTGMAAGYGLAALEKKLRAIMAAARAGDTASLDQAFAETTHELARGGAALREILQNEVA